MRRGAMAITSIVALGLAMASVAQVQARGGNHGCDTGAGTFYSDHFFESGDNVVGGFRIQSIIMGGTQHVLASQNTPTGGGTPSSLTCGADEGAWTLFQSRLGPGDDSVRLDAVGIELPDQYGPIPKTIDSELSGGGGADTIRGHKGFDDISGGSGRDVIKADDGKHDVVACGSGKDKADVDSKDDVSGCETKT